MPHKPNARPAKRDAGPSQRQLRAGELVRHRLAEILLDNEVQDPDLKGVSVTVTEVRLSPDLKVATCFVQPLGGTGAPAVAAALNRAARFLRGRLGRLLDLKFTPELRFVHDASFDAAARLDGLFAQPEVARDLGGPSSPDGESS